MCYYFNIWIFTLFFHYILAEKKGNCNNVIRFFFHLGIYLWVHTWRGQGRASFLVRNNNFLSYVCLTPRCVQLDASEEKRESSSFLERQALLSSAYFFFSFFNVFPFVHTFFCLLSFLILVTTFRHQLLSLNPSLCVYIFSQSSLLYVIEKST